MAINRTYKDDINIKFDIWDTAGQEKFQSIVTTYFKEACGIILMFDFKQI